MRSALRFILYSEEDYNVRRSFGTELSNGNEWPDSGRLQPYLEVHSFFFFLFVDKFSIFFQR